MNNLSNKNSLDAPENEIVYNSILRYIPVDFSELRKNVFNTKILKVDKMAFLVCKNFKLYGQDLNEVIQNARVNTWFRVRDEPILSFLKFNIGAYFLTCIRNGAIKFGKDRKKTNYEDIDEIDVSRLPQIFHQDETPDFFMDNASKMGKIKGAMSERDFRMFELFGVFNKSYQEIADELGFNNASTVGTRINRIRKKMKLLRKKGEL